MRHLADPDHGISGTAQPDTGIADPGCHGSGTGLCTDHCYRTLFCVRQARRPDRAGHYPDILDPFFLTADRSGRNRLGISAASPDVIHPVTHIPVYLLTKLPEKPVPLAVASFF